MSNARISGILRPRLNVVDDILFLATSNVWFK